MNANICHKTFADINVNDVFFQSLKNDYPDFVSWFQKKGSQDAFVQYDENGNILGFLYLKIEENSVDDVRPKIKANKILKVGTFKINAHGTKMGEQFIKIIMDYAINEDVDICYTTIFEKHHTLIALVEKYGFEEYGEKGDYLKPEKVFVKNMRQISGDINKDYPLIKTQEVNKYVLSIYPKYHSVMFPDSILTTENKNIITDVSYTNSIHKIYVCTMGVDILKKGDIVVLYRTAEYGRSAEYSAVATSICVVDSVKKQSEFGSFDDFYAYASKYSVFNKADLRYWYNRGGCKAVKMTYNIAMKRRVVRHDLINTVGLNRNEYWGFFQITDQQFSKIIQLSQVNPNILK
jgi:hypothetical protein